MFFDVFVYFAVLTRGREQHNFPILNGIPKTSRGGRGMSYLHVGSCIADVFPARGLLHRMARVLPSTRHYREGVYGRRVG